MKLNKQIKTTMSLAAAKGTLGLFTTAALLAGFVGSESAHAASVAIEGSGWNEDIIMQAGETYASSDKQGTLAWFTEGYAAANITSGTYQQGVPDSGAITLEGKAFQFESYDAPNAFSDLVDGTFTLDTPASFTEISVLGTEIAGGVNLTLNFSDASSTAWNIGAGAFDGTWINPGTTLNPGMTANGTATGGWSGAMGVETFVLSPADQAKTLVSIDLDFGNAIVWGFSGEAVPEPTTTALLGLGGLALILRRRK